MTIRQTIMKALYPLIMLKGKLPGSTGAYSNKTAKRPNQPFYSLSATLNSGKPFDLTTLRGKKILLVNTASDCGFTAQYEELQKLYLQHAGRLEILGFPANDFKQQERANNEEIAAFCKLNFGVTFPLMQKSGVVKGAGQNPIFKWLSDASLNGWNDKAPGWNFAKYLVDEEGTLTHFFNPEVSPLSDTVTSQL